MAFEEFLARFSQIKGRGDPTKSRLYPLLQEIIWYNQDPTLERLDYIAGIAHRVKRLKKNYARKITSKYRSAFEILEDEIQAERLRLMREVELKGAPKPQRRVTPARSRSLSSRLPMERKVSEIKRPASRQAVRKPSPTPNEAARKIQRAWVRCQAERKLKKAAETAAALREIGYGLEWKPGPKKGDRQVRIARLQPREHKYPDEKGEYYKHLEPNVIWEAVDPKHRAGHQLGKEYNTWLRDEKIQLSFWDYLERKYGERIYRVLYVKKEDLHAYRVNIKRDGLKRGRDWDGGQIFDTSPYLSITGLGIVVGWGIYVQSRTNEVYSGSALMKEGKGGFTPLLPKDVKYNPDKTIDLTGVIVLHHSSFLRGKPVRGAGEWMVRDGRLKSISNMTGHYKTPPGLFMDLLKDLQRRGVQLSNVTVKWPWPDLLDKNISYYNAQDFVEATDIEYLKEPYKADGPLRAVGGPEDVKYLEGEHERIDSGVQHHAPPSRIPPRKQEEVKIGQEVGYQVVLEVFVCTRCKNKEEVCECHLKRR